MPPNISRDPQRDHLFKIGYEIAERISAKYERQNCKGRLEGEFFGAAKDGLMDVMATFDPARAAPEAMEAIFRTTAKERIIGAIKDYLRDKARQAIKEHEQAKTLHGQDASRKTRN